MKLSLEKLKSLFPSSTVIKGKNLKIVCPKCGKQECYVSIDTENHPGRCWRENNCGFRFNIFSLLNEIGRLSEFTSEYSSYSEVVEGKLLLDGEEVPLNLVPTKQNLPIGFKFLKKHIYLESRSFTESDYERYIPGETRIYPKFTDTVIFPVIENFEIYGFVSRSIFSKEECEKLEILRYQKSESDFSKILYGFNYENKCKTVILVEGIFDLKTVQDTIDSYNLDMICIPLLGVSLSFEQVLKLKLYGVENIIYLLDKDIEVKFRVFAVKYLHLFNNFVGFCKEKDPGDSTVEEVYSILQNVDTLESYLLNKVVNKLKI